MMRLKKTVLYLTLFFMISGANAALISRGGGLIYDSTQNITWMRDASYSLTIGDDADGLMNHGDALAYANAFVYSNSGGTYSNWRLPTTTVPDAGCNLQDDPLPGQSQGSGCTGSEMGHLLGVDGVSFWNPGIFLNVSSQWYWSETEYAHNANQAWQYNFQTDSQFIANKTGNSGLWLVMDGDVAQAVPIPAAAWLFASALGISGWIRRRKLLH